MKTRYASDIVRDLENRINRLARLQGLEGDDLPIISNRMAAEDKSVNLDVAPVKKAIEVLKSEFKGLLSEIGDLQTQLDDDDEVTFDEDVSNPLRSEARVLQNGIMNHLDQPGSDLAHALHVLDESVEAIQEIEAVFNKINKRMKSIRK